MSCEKFAAKLSKHGVCVKPVTHSAQNVNPTCLQHPLLSVFLTPVCECVCVLTWVFVVSSTQSVCVCVCGALGDTAW